MIRALSCPSLAAVAVALSLLGGCGGSSDVPVAVEREGRAPGSGSGAPGELVLADPSALPAPLARIEADPVRVGSVPVLAAVETLADSGLQIAYTDAAQRARVEPLRVGAQWQHMQSCVMVVAPAPLVLVRAEVEPFGPEDDVIRDIEGRISASATELVDGVAILQVRVAPFDGSRPDAGFGLLRQIMGRHLWFSAGLLERFYPSECAREAPPGTPARLSARPSAPSSSGVPSGSSAVLARAER